ncbi:hypothetical protein THAOC_32371 [Thalassiosira oceanica]|uniref:Uncharacterized protein n=1 Tax=Thalassiosira oceanica TaxID=159749 RepID=K0RQ36_THAOC|nr:hypothetical protein THAOC_32371 [Thalassiosira oceanica]|eukprot:EJK48802.1 hypothetical protein THAOC_32371 [Thalassiosira oceanica]
MPSRKKAQGRRNRARKEAIRTAELRTLWEPLALYSRSNHVAIPCEHTLTSPPEIPLEGPAVSFMNHIAGEGFFSKKAQFLNESAVDTCFKSVAPFPDVWKEDKERALAIDLLLRFLRNLFVHDPAVEGEYWFHQYRHNEPKVQVNNVVVYGLTQWHRNEQNGRFRDSPTSKLALLIKSAGRNINNAPKTAVGVDDSTDSQMSESDQQFGEYAMHMS